MNTYLLIWNPLRWHWWSDITDAFEKRRGKYHATWSSGASRAIQPGDRVFLARVGQPPKGIVAAGYATSDVYQGRHWAPHLARKGVKTWYVDCSFETALNPAREPILSIGQLEQYGLKYNWTPRASGTRIHSDIAEPLERLWRRFLNTKRHPLLVPTEASAVEGIRKEITAYSRGRSRVLRDAALAHSKGICEACRIDFSKVLGGKGVRALQVHHRKQFAVSERPRITKQRDLAVLCANCHSLVHMDPRNALPVEKLRRLLRGG